MEYLFVSNTDVDTIINSYCETLKKEYVQLENVVLVGVSNGGYEVAKRINSLLPETTLIIYKPDDDPQMDANDTKKIRGKNAIICEDSTISGDTLNKAIYVVKHNKAVDCRSMSIVYRRSSKIIPNLYSIECENGVLVVFPWKKLPVRNYLYKKIKILRMAKGDEPPFKQIERLKYNERFLTLLRGKQVKEYHKRTIIADGGEGYIIGTIQFWEGVDELFIDKIQGFLPRGNELKGIIRELYLVVLNYAHFHCKDRLSFVIPREEQEKWINERYTLTKEFDDNGKRYCEMMFKGDRPLR